MKHNIRPLGGILSYANILQVIGVGWEVGLRPLIFKQHISMRYLVESLNSYEK